MNELVVRAATVADRGALIRLMSAQLEEHRLPVDADGIARGVELALAAGSSAWLVLATLAGIPAAALLGNPNVSVEKGGAVLWIDELYVEPRFRRRGIARAMVEWVAVEARNAGMSSLELEVVRGMESAAALWRSLGFEPLERQRYSRNF